jgi:hypothetical protein
MPVWKTNPSFLRLSLKSILEQSYDKFELLVIYQKSQEKIDSQIEKIFNENDILTIDILYDKFVDPTLSAVEQKQHQIRSILYDLCKNRN